MPLQKLFVYLGKKNMGLTIHYRGNLKSAELLPDLINEIVDIVKIYDWKYDIFEKEYPDNKFYEESFNDAYGIVFSPPKCEPVYLTFLSDGKMANPFYLKYYKEDKENGKKMTYWVFTKTQYAGIEVHKVIIQLFRYISKKYLVDFEMMDEGRYWETNDVQVLQESFARYNFIMDKFAEALDSFTEIENDDNDPESMINKLIDYLKNKFGDQGFDFKIISPDDQE